MNCPFDYSKRTLVCKQEPTLPGGFFGLMTQRDTQAQGEGTFPGFDVPQQNWFKMPNNWTDITAEISSIAELKVVEYVLRHTWGFQEYGVKRAITIDEFQHGRKSKEGSRMDKGTGLSKQSVITGVKTAVQRGLLEEEVDDSDKARVKKFYLLRMRRDPENRGGVKKLDADVKTFDTGVKDLDIGGQKVRHRTKKETLERKQQQVPLPQNDTTSDDTPNSIAAALIEQGITTPVAHHLVEQYSRRRIEDNLDWFAWKVKHYPAAIKTNPAGLLRRAIEQDYASEGQHQGFQTRQQQAAAQTAKKQRRAAQERLLQTRNEEQTAALNQKELARAKQLDILREQYQTTAQTRQLWQQVLENLKPAITPLKFNLHLATSELLAISNQEAVISVPTNFTRAWIEDNVSPLIEKALRQHLKIQAVTLQVIALDHVE